MFKKVLGLRIWNSGSGFCELLPTTAKGFMAPLEHGCPGLFTHALCFILRFCWMSDPGKVCEKASKQQRERERESKQDRERQREREREREREKEQNPQKLNRVDCARGGSPGPSCPVEEEERAKTCVLEPWALSMVPYPCL